MATLDIGPGRNVQPHFDQPVIRLDMRGEVSPSVVGDAKALPFRSDSFTTLYASHILEHFKIEDAFDVVKEWVRVTKPGGELQIFVPNLEWCAHQIVNGIYDYFVMNALFGGQYYDGDLHKTGFTPKSLKEMLSSFPLDGIEPKLFRNTICVWAKKQLQ